MRSKLLSIAIVTGFMFVACSKEENTSTGSSSTTTAGTTTSGTTTSGTTGGSASAVYGFLNAINIKTDSTGSSGTAAGQGVALFASPPFSPAMTVSTTGLTTVSAGTVTLNGSALTPFINNIYITFSALSQITPSPTWNVTGNSTAGISAISYTNSSSIPTLASLSSAVTITKASGYTLTHASITGADSVLYSISDKMGNTVSKTATGTSTTHTFSASDLAALTNTSKAEITITATKFSYTTVSGKKYGFGNSSQYKRTKVTIQ